MMKTASTNLHVTCNKSGLFAKLPLARAPTDPHRKGGTPRIQGEKITLTITSTLHLRPVNEVLAASARWTQGPFMTYQVSTVQPSEQGFNYASTAHTHTMYTCLGLLPCIRPLQVVYQAIFSCVRYVS